MTRSSATKRTHRVRDVPPWIALVLLLVGLPLAGSSGTNTGLLSMALGTGTLLALVFVLLFRGMAGGAAENDATDRVGRGAVGRHVGVFRFRGRSIGGP